MAKTVIHGANIGYVKTEKLVPVPIPVQVHPVIETVVEDADGQPVVENPVKVVEKQPVLDSVVENPEPETSGTNEGGTGQGEFVDHSIEGGWKAKRDKKKVLPYGIKEKAE